MSRFFRSIPTISLKFFTRFLSVCFCAAFFIFIQAVAAQAATFTSTQTGNWNIGTTWGGACASSCTEGTDFPGASDTVNVTSTHVVTVPTGITAHFNDITVRGTATLKLTGQLNGGSLTVKSGTTVTQDCTSLQTLTGTLSVESGGTLNHTANTTSLAYEVNFSVTTATIAGAINVNNKGYAGGTSGRGSGPGAAYYTSVGGQGGASYGGYGGDGTNDLGATSTYNSLSLPNDLGSGGTYGGSGAANGGAGGGLIHIAATDMTVSGSVTANAAAGSVGTACYVGSGGSGGGIYLSVSRTLDATGGTITANGGAGASNCNNSGGGSGGRIAFSGYTSYVAPTTLTAAGGLSGGSISSGGAGTIFVKSSTNNGTLTYDENNSALAALSPIAADLSIDEIAVKRGANLSIPSGVTVTTTQSTFNSPTGNASTITISGTFDPQNSTFTFPASTTPAMKSTGVLRSVTNLTVNSSSSTLVHGFTNSVTSLAIGSGGTLTLDSYTTTTALSLTTLTVSGTLTSLANAATQSHVVNISATTVTVSGSINVNNKGYAGSSSGRGSGPGAAYYTAVGGQGGASYGGYGGDGTNDLGATSTYSTMSLPDDLGSGGTYGGSGAANGGAGGGLVKIVATNVTVSGSITANAAAGSAGTSCYVGSGGSGGGIYLSVSGTLDATGGTVTANGGAGASLCNNSGGGSGGRIAFIGYTSYVAPTTLTASGGLSGGSISSGGAGTIFVQSSSNNGTLTLDDANNASPAQTPVPNLNIDEIVIKKAAYLSIPSGITVTTTQSTFNSPSGSASYINLAGTFNPQNTSFTFPASTTPAFKSTGVLSTVTTLTINSVSSTLVHGFTNSVTGLTVGSGATLTLDSFTTTTALSLTTLSDSGTITTLANSATQSHVVNISATTVTISGSINVNNKGYAGSTTAVRGSGPGGAQYTGAGGQGGADYGGYGGDGQYGGSTSTYGTISLPDDLGSGGSCGCSGGSNGGAGGGLVKIVATTLTLSGTITANGQTGSAGTSGYAGSGGSGGGIYLSISGTLDATGGTITANGGTGVLNLNASGGGGGGRIAILNYTSYTAPTTLSASGGAGGSTASGGAGTIFVKSSSNNGTITLDDNNSASPAQTPLASGTYDEIVIRKGAYLSIPSGVSVTTTQSTFNSPTGATSYVNLAGTFNPQNSAFTFPASTTVTFASTGAFTSVSTLTVNSVSSTIMSGSSLGVTTMTLGSNGTTTMIGYTTGTTAFTVTNMYVSGTVTGVTNTTLESNIVKLSATTFVLGTGAYIQTNYQGYQGGQAGSSNGSGPGGSYSVVAGGQGGASHGGTGGNGVNSGGATSTYDSIILPKYMGSGGAYAQSAGVNGGAGGGYIWITATNMTVSGTIQALGKVGLAGGTGGFYAGGGGSGGGVYLDVSGTLTAASGTINVGGGNGSFGGAGNPSGGGGGGRIAIGTLEGALSSAPTMTVSGGAAGGGGATAGASGTKENRPDTSFSLSANYSNLTLPSSISGTSSYQYNQVSSVDVSIMRVSDSYYWNGSTWVSSETWNAGTGTSTWSYSLAGITWTDGVSYTVRSRATDSVSVQEANYPTATFAYSVVGTPQAPTGVTASSVSTSTLHLAWTDNSSGGTEETSFIIYQSTDDATYTQYGSVAADTVSTNLSGLTPNTLYYFKVTAFNSTYGGNTSTAISTTTSATAPASVTASGVTNASVPLSWSANGNAAGTSFQILNDTTSTWVVATTTATSYTVTGLSSNTAYTFGVRAVQTGSSPNTFSSETTYTTTTLPDTPSAPSGLALSSITDTTLTLTWTDNASGANEETSEVISKSTDGSTFANLTTLPADTTSYPVTALTPNKTYYFKVTAINVSGAATSSAASTSTIVKVPTSFTVGTVTTSTVPLSWNANSNAAGTVFEIFNDTTSSWSVATTTGTSYTVSGLSPFVAYTFGVKAQQAGSSPTSYSSEVTVTTTTLADAPAAPSSLILSAVSTSTLSLSWTDNSSGATEETSMVVSRSTNGSSYSTVATLAADTTSYSTTGLTPNQIYYYKVTASNISGSNSSSAVSTTTLVMPPTSFTGASLTTSSTIPLSWSANGNAGGTVYEILQETTSTWSVATTTATSYTVTGLVYDTPYTIGVRAWQANSSPTTYSSEVTYATTTALYPPPAPDGLVLTNVATSSVLLSWTDNSSADHEETNMKVYKSTNDATYTLVDNMAADSVNDTIASLTPNTLYYFTVEALNRSGSGTSTSVSTSTVVMPPASFTHGTVTTSTVPLSWSANGNAAGTVFDILNETTSTWTIATTTATSYTVTGLTPTSTYTFGLRAEQVNSSPTIYSSEVTVSATTNVDLPAAPTGLALTNVSTSTMTLSWTDNSSGATEEANMIVSRSTDNISYTNIATLAADTITTSITGLTPNRTYYFKVTATNASGSGVSSAVTTSTVAMPPTSLTASAVTTSTVPLSWSANGNAAGTVFEILQETTSTWSLATTTATSYTVRNLDSVTAYTFGVRAWQNGSSPTTYSSEAAYTTTTALDAPIAPSDLAVSNLATSTLTLTWTDNSSGGTEETSEYVSRSTDNVTYTTIQTLAADTVTTNITGLTPNKTYYFKVWALNVSGSATTTAVSTSTVVMPPATLTASGITTSTIPLSWSANGNPGGTVYEILNETTSTWSMATTTATSYSVTGLSSLTSYTFGVHAEQIASSPTSYSSEATYTTTTQLDLPTAPSSLTFTNVATSTLTLSWTDNASGGNEETNMRVSRSTDDVTYTQVALLSADVTTADLSGMTPNTTYYFKVSATNGSGGSTSTAVSTSTIVMAPSALTSSAVTSSTVPLTWSANGNASGTVYEILNETTSTWSIATTTASAYTVTNLSSNTAYTFGLHAVQIASSPTTYSSEVTYTTTTLLDTPNAPTDVVSTDVSTSTLTLTWTDNSSGGTEEANMVVLRSTDGVSYATQSTLAADSVTTDVTSLTPNQTYYFEVVARNGTGSGTSTPYSTSTLATMPSSLATSTMPTTSTVAFTWSANGNAAGTVYEILNNTTSSWSMATTTATSYTVHALDPFTAYVFGVRAIQAGDSSRYSSTQTLSVTTSVDVPGAPTGLTASAVATSSLALTWTDNASGGTEESSVVVLSSTDNVTYATVATLAADSTTTTVNSLTPNTTYYFKVRATNVAGSATSTAETTSTLVMTPASLTATSVSTSTIALSWSAHGNAGGTVYDVLNETTSTWTIATTTATSYTVDGLLANTAYTFGLRAEQIAASPLSYSSEITYTSTTSIDIPTAPTSLAIVNLATSTLTLTWADTSSGSNEEDNVIVSQSLFDVSYADVATLAADTTSTDIVGLTPNTTYYYKVTTRNGAGSTTSTAVSTSTVAMTPASLTAFGVTTSTIPLSWSSNANGAGTVYEIYNETTSTWTMATTTATIYTISNLDANTAYTFGVRAQQRGSSPVTYSSEITYATTTPLDSPNVPTDVSASDVTTSTLALSWTDASAGGSEETQVLVYASTDNSHYTVTSTLPADATSTTVTGLEANQTYYFKITALNDAGAATSTAVSTSTIVMFPDAVTSTSVTSSTIPLSWLSNGNVMGTVYEILNETTSTWLIATTTADAYTVRDLSPGTAYALGIRAQQMSNPSFHSVEIPYTTTTLLDLPTAPSSLVFSNVLPTSVDLSWTDNASGGTEETAMVVSQSVDDATYTDVASLAADTTSTSITGLTPNQLYYYKVTAKNDVGASTSTAVSTSTIVLFPDAVTSTHVTTSTIPMQWSANGNAMGTVYELLNETTSSWSIATTTATSYTITNLNPGTLYDIGVRAIQNGRSGDYSTEVPYTTTTLLDVPAAPSGLTVSALSTSTVSLTWTDNASGGTEESNMIVSESTDDVSYANIATLAADTTSTTVSGLTPNATYFFKVAAVSDAGASTSTAVSTSTIVMMPASLTNDGLVTTSTVPLTWLANANASGTVYQIRDVTGAPVVIATTTATSYTVTGLTATTGYTFGVRAEQIGSSPTSYSAQVTYTTTTPANAPTIPSAPSALSVSALTTSTLQLSWTGNATGDGEETSEVVSLSLDDATYTPVATVAADVTSTSLSGLTPNVLVYLKVSAQNTAGASTSTATTTTLVVMPPVSLVASDVSTSSLRLSWSGNGNASGTMYQVRDLTFGSVSFVTAVTSTVLTGLTSDTGYQFGVRAIQNGSDPASYSSQMTTDATTTSDAPTVPTAPSGVTIVSVATSSVALSWTDTSSGLSEEDAFRISVSTDDVSYSAAATAAADTTSTTLTDLAPNTAYFFKVSATNGAGSATSSAVTSTTIVMPATSFTVSNVTTSTLDLVWSANGNPDGTQYQIRDLTFGSVSFVTTGTSSTLSDLSPGTTYQFGIRAVQIGSSPTSYSAQMTLTTTTEETPLSPPAAPTGLAVSDVTTSTLTLSWTDNARGSNEETSEVVSQSLDDATYVPIATLSADVTSTSITGLDPDTTYFFKVSATNDAGTATSSAVSTTTATMPSWTGVVTDVSLEATGSSALMTWTNPADTDFAYVMIRRSTTDYPTSTSSDAYVTSTLDSSYEDAGLADGVYYYTLFAMSTYGAASTGVHVMATIDTTPPSAPTAFRATPAGSNAALSWTNPSDLDFANLVLRRSTSAYPANAYAGTGVFSSTTTNTYTDTSLSDGLYYYSLFAEDASGNISAAAHATATIDTLSPTISAVTSTAATSSVTITWSTDISASSRIVYSLDTSYISTTAETDAGGSGVTDHTVLLTDLTPCARYHYKVVSRTATLHASTSTDQVFVTQGCVGDATIIATNDNVAPIVSGGTFSLGLEDFRATLIVPVGYASEDASFQMKRLEQTAVIDALGTPAGTVLVGSDNHIFDFHAFLSDQSTISSFLVPIQVVLHYDASEAVGLQESQFHIYRYDDNTWYALSDCSVDTSARSVSCTTTRFSTFGLFAPAPSLPHASGSGGSGGGGITAPMPVQAQSLSVPGQDQTPSTLWFDIDNGATTTRSRVLHLRFNANPPTVKGVSISLDPAFPLATVLPYAASTTYALPDVTGNYRVYVRYYSTTGLSSNTLMHAIAYQGSEASAPVVTSSSGSSTTSSRYVFKRQLKLNSKGEDVRRLQQFLNTHGCILAKKGPGSPGKETTTYGYAMQNAVKYCQEKNASVLLKPAKLKKGTGIFGDLMRAWANKLMK